MVMPIWAMGLVIIIFCVLNLIFVGPVLTDFTWAGPVPWEILFGAIFPSGIAAILAGWLSFTKVKVIDLPKS